MAPTIPELLTRRVRDRGSEPLLTYYDLGTGERTELSAVSFGNWVDKTANLLVDEIGTEGSDRVSLPLALQAPGHWVTFVWQLACWRAGVVVDLTDPAGEVAVVTGPDWEPYEWRRVYACSLHPLGLGFDVPLAVGVEDYAVAVRSQPDAYVGPPSGAGPAWHDAERTLDQAELVAAGAAAGPTAARRLVRAADPWTTCRDGLLTAIVSGGSSVVVVGEDEDLLAHLVTTERITG